MSSLPLVQPCLFLGSCHHAWALSPNPHHPVCIQTPAHRVTTSDDRIPNWKRAGRQGRLKEYFCQAACRLSAGYEEGEGHTRVTECSAFSHTPAELSDTAQMLYEAGSQGTFIKGNTNMPLGAIEIHFTESSTVSHSSGWGEKKQLTLPFRDPFRPLKSKLFNRISELTKEFTSLRGYSPIATLSSTHLFSHKIS